MKPVIIIAIIVVFGIGVGLSLDVSAEEGLIPSWIKNTALWYGEGQVNDTEFISALQFLINQNIIKIPITEVNAANVNLSDNDRAMSFIVRFSDGDFFTAEVTIYTFSVFEHLTQTIDSDILDLTKSFDETPAFILRSLPSADKNIIYDLVDSYVEAGRTPEAFKVAIDAISGDGQVIQTWDYRKCNVNFYSTYVNENTERYQYSDSDEMEIREVFVFTCAGFRIN